MNKFLCFVHIEKSGGITLHNMLHRNYFSYISPNPSYASYFTSKQLRIANKLFFGGVKGLGGHKVGSFLDYESVISKPIFYFSFVRNPIDRYLSHLNWQKFIMNIDWSIDEFINNKEFNNYQCFRIGGNRTFELAKVQIDSKYGFLGLLENYDESLLILNKMLGDSFDVKYQKSNEKSYGDKKITWRDLDERQKLQVVENNKEDLKLFNYVKDELFPSYKQEYKITESDLNLFLNQNEKYRFKQRILFKRKISNKIISNIIQRFF